MTTLFEQLNELVAAKLVRRRDYDDGLCIFKYQPRVQWDNLWNQSPTLLRARGIVFTKEGEQLNDPLPKIFYLGENGTKVSRDQIVYAERKVNGFYASTFSYRGESRVATTGTLDSVYVQYAEEILGGRNRLGNHHYSYEIVHPKDPHIVPELPGAYSLGMVLSSYNTPELIRGRLSDIVEYTKKVKHEGFVVYDADTLAPLCKLKSPYYLSLKLLARGIKEFKQGKEMAHTPKEKMRQRLDEEYYPMLDYIYDDVGIHIFASLEEQERLGLMQEYLHFTTLKNEHALYK